MRVNPDHRYFWDQIHGLFGTVLVIDRELRVIYACDRVKRHMPSLGELPAFFDTFEVQRPANMGSFEDAADHIGSLFLLIAKDKSFALRGQIIRYDNQGDDCLIFCGAPWLLWLNTNRADVRLGLADFSAQDVQLDQLFYMSTEQNMVEDLEALNTQLQQAKQQLEQAQHAKNAFFAQMSHEMRTPLNGVVSALALLQQKPLADDAREILDLAHSASGNLLRVINYILDVSKIEADEGLKIQALNLGELIASTLEIVAASAREKGLAVRSRIDPALGPCHEADPDRLQQILLNLLVNAIKFTDEGSVSVEALPATAPECSVRFEVNDTGVGIDKTNQTRIFAPFVSQGNIGESSSAQGTGLGLDIVSRSVQAMGGRVGVSSAPGAGSSFWVELPLAEAASDVASDARWHSAEAPREAVESIDARVMLVDDNETNLMLGTMIFESLGMTVTPVSSGAEAVQLADPAKQDLIFMDISMPGMDGYEATRLIRQRFSAKSLPVIALSAYASSVENRKAQDAGMNDYLVKPMNLDDGVAVIRSHLPADRLRLTGGVEHDSHTESVLIDEQTLRDLKRQIGQESLNTVIGKFLGEARSRWALLQGGVDSESRGREAHTLASTCSSFGLTPVADALRAVEARARNCEIEESEQLDRINALLEQSLTRLSAVVSQL